LITGIRTRTSKDSNYHGIYCNGKTLRTPIDPSKPVLELEYPEFFDVKLTSYCTGKCDWCYMDSKDNESHVIDALDKIQGFFGPMSLNERPFQVALGGGNPNEHPDFAKILALFSDLEITPNYTTNGYGLTDEVMDATKAYCGGVAVSCHPHLKNVWEPAAEKLISSGIKTALHHIISDEASVDRMFEILLCDRWDLVEYHVLLPLIPQGRAKSRCEASDYLFTRLKELDKASFRKVAFGAKFYEDLCARKSDVPVSLYEPEMMSKYLDLKDMRVYGSSFLAAN
jgi:hypothetical protein